MTRIEQYHERRRVVAMLHDLALNLRFSRPDVAESAYRMAMRLDEQNTRLAQVIANLEAGGRGMMTP